MADIDPLVERNQHFAPTGAHLTAKISPRANVCLITCLDPRTDPANFFELQLGDAAVIRNAGGRVTQGVIDDIAYISYMSAVKLNPGDSPLFEVAVIHHNQCGTRFLADDDFRHAYADHVHGDEAALAAEAVTDPEATVRHDVELLRSATTISSRISVSGHVYDVETGLLTTILPAAPMHHA